MFTPARIIRATLDAVPGLRPPFTQQQLEKRDLILAAALPAMAEQGYRGVKMASFAASIRISPVMIRRIFCDLESVLAEILRRHLADLTGIVGAIPADASGCFGKRRAAYHEAARTVTGGFTESHLLLVRDRHLLPPDLSETIEPLRLSVGEMLAPGHGEFGLGLLDSPTADLARVEAIFARLAASDTPPVAAKPAAARLVLATPHAFPDTSNMTRH